MEVLAYTYRCAEDYDTPKEDIQDKAMTALGRYMALYLLESDNMTITATLKRTTRYAHQTEHIYELEVATT